MTVPRPHAEARVVAQAKVNLYLRVLAREDAGFHQLETLFQRLELGDDVVVRVGGRGRAIDARGADVGPAERNLAWRAAVAYADAAGWPDAFAIEIDKRIPVGGGLGGGSADAGAVLRCLDRLNARPIGAAALLDLAARLGSDVPFLTAECPLALAWGRGERLLALPPLPPRRVSLGLFERGVPTADAFGAFARARATGPAEPPRPIVWSHAQFASWDAVALVATNDLEPAVFAARPDVAELREALATIGREVTALHLAEHPGRAGGGDTEAIALMTGSGATVFLLLPDVEGLGVVLGFDSPADPTPAPPFRFEQTRTATRVAAVQLSG
jgi:4-diphosphocytidyl-2-C-methyl-D-erythritol kinase